jgi:hypothetical protein
MTDMDLGEMSDGYHTFNEIYEHRGVLFVALMKCNVDLSWYSLKHNDGSMFKGWMIAGMNLPSGTITYHLPNTHRFILKDLGIKHLDVAPPWDGHTAKDVIFRIKKWVSSGIAIYDDQQAMSVLRQ